MAKYKRITVENILGLIHKMIDKYDHELTVETSNIHLKYDYLGRVAALSELVSLIEKWK